MNDAAKAPSISFRAVTPEDEEFLLKLYKSSRGDDLRGLGWSEDRISEFLEMQYEARQRLHENDYQNATDEIVLLADRKSTRLNSSHSQISYAVFCLKKKKKQKAT